MNEIYYKLNIFRKLKYWLLWKYATRKFIPVKKYIKEVEKRKRHIPTEFGSIGNFRFLELKK